MASPNDSTSSLALLGLANRTSRLAALLVGTSLVVGLIFLESTSTALVSAKTWVLDYFDWLFVIVANVAIACVAGSST